MKSNPNKNRTSLVQASTADRQRGKKVLLFTPNSKFGQLLAREVKNADKVVVETVHDLLQMIHEIARTTPHLLVAHLPEDAALIRSFREEVERYFPDLPVCMLHGDLSEQPPVWKHTLQAALGQPIQLETPRNYAEGFRNVLHDESLQAFWKGRLNRPPQGEGWEKVCFNQEIRFVLQLQTARKNHPSAKQYFKCLLAQQVGLDQDNVVEIKCGKSAYWNAAKFRSVSQDYYGQVQQIMAVTNLESLDFFCYWPGYPDVLIPVRRDDRYIDRLLQKGGEFWNAVQTP
jgi:hypothetical protein